MTSEANPPVPSAPVAKTSLPKTDDLLTLRDRVVTLASLEGRTSAIRRVAVPRGAIVTPAVRDFLREKGLSLEFVAASQIVTGGPGGVRMTLVAMGTPFDPTPLVAMLQSDGLAVNDSKSDCLIESVGELAESVRSGALGLLLTKHVPAALCLANRREGVRAIAGGTAEETEKATRSVGANLLVVDPAKGGRPEPDENARSGVLFRRRATVSGRLQIGVEVRRCGSRKSSET